MEPRDFYARFTTEKDCILYLKEKLNKGVVGCKHCKNNTLKWNEKHLYWRCKCMNKISVKSMTFMRDSNISLLKWFEAIYLFTSSKKPISDLEFSRKIGIKRYRTVHYLLLKIRKQMSLSLNRLDFEKIIDLELNEDIECNLLIKPSENRKTDKIRLLLPKGFMKPYSFLQATNYSMKKILASIDSKNYELPYLSYIKPKWKNIIKINYTKIIDGIFHGITNFHIQLYLDEYTYKYNNRYEKNHFETFLDLDINWSNSD